MGCDIHMHVEKKLDDGSYAELHGVNFLDCRSYGIFGFLADVRNYSAVTPISQPRGVPDDVSAGLKADYESWGSDAHSASWLSVEELLAFNYDAPTEDRRVMRQVGPNHWNGGCTTEPGEGRLTTYREFLGSWFMDELEALKASGADRIVFWFDN